MDKEQDPGSHKVTSCGLPGPLERCQCSGPDEDCPLCLAESRRVTEALTPVGGPGWRLQLTSAWLAHLGVLTVQDADPFAFAFTGAVFSLVAFHLLEGERARRR